MKAKYFLDPCDPPIDIMKQSLYRDYDSSNIEMLIVQEEPRGFIPIASMNDRIEMANNSSKYYGLSRSPRIAKEHKTDILAFMKFLDSKEPLKSMKSTIFVTDAVWKDYPEEDKEKIKNFHSSNISIKIFGGSNDEWGDHTRCDPSFAKYKPTHDVDNEYLLRNCTDKVKEIYSKYI